MKEVESLHQVTLKGQEENNQGLPIHESRTKLTPLTDAIEPQCLAKPCENFYFRPNLCFVKECHKGRGIEKWTALLKPQI